jgi:hypothetical protein
MNIDELTIGQVKQINSWTLRMLNSDDEDPIWQPFSIGEAYLIRTVTHITIGVVEAVGEKEILMRDASWIADTGRYHNALKDGTLSEVEPYVSDVIIGRGAIVDATRWLHDLPLEQK